MELLIYAVILSFVLTLVLGFIMIPMLQRLKVGQNVRDDGPKSHLKKAGTPTMGGIFFTIPLVFVSLIFARDNLDFIVVCVLVTLAYGFIGFIDDYIKVVMKRSLGLKAYQKLLGQIVIAVVFTYFAYGHRYIGSSVYIPFTDGQWDLGIMYIPAVALGIVYMVNSVNLTDGVDGLASGVTLIAAVVLSIIAAFAAAKAGEEGAAYLAANYRNIMIFSGALAGACLGFLRYNIHPARVFMGDTGSMTLGGAIVAIAVLMKLPLLLPILGGIYVIESLSVILQVISFKTTGKRIFKMSPIHHHFELAGMSESRVVAMFMIAALVLGLLALLAV